MLRALLLLGVLLIPFSSGAGPGSVVVAYGLVPLAVFGTLFVMALSLRPTVPRVVAPAWGAAALLAFALAAGTAYAPRPIESLARSAAGLLGFAAFAFVLSPFYPAPASASGVPTSTRRSEDVVWVLVMSGGLMAAYFLIHYAVAIASVGLLGVVVDRGAGGAMSLPWGSSNVVASCFLFPFFLAFYLGRRERSRGRRWAAHLARLLMLVSIVATVSRGAMVALLFGVVAHAVIAGRGRRRGIVVASVAAILCAVVADLLNGGQWSGQLLELAGSRLDRTEVSQLNGRTDRWTEFGGLFMQAPLIGAGYFGSFATAGGTGHNLVLTTLVERGLLGTLCSAVVLSLATWRALAGRLRARDAQDRLLFSCILSGGAASLLHLMVEDANSTHQYIVYSWLALALPIAAWWERVVPRVIEESTAVAAPLAASDALPS